jgi:hypothetical protein
MSQSTEKFVEVRHQADPDTGSSRWAFYVDGLLFGAVYEETPVAEVKRLLQDGDADGARRVIVENIGQVAS